MGVSFFIVLSSFITHWVYGGGPSAGVGGRRRPLIKFYANRLDRVLLTGTLTILTYWVLGKCACASKCKSYKLHYPLTTPYYKMSNVIVRYIKTHYFMSRQNS